MCICCQTHDNCIATESSEIALCIYISCVLGAVIVPVLFILGDKSATVSAIIENALGSFISWTGHIMISWTALPMYCPLWMP